MRIIALCGNSTDGQNQAGSYLCREHGFVIVNATCDELAELVEAIQNGRCVGVAALAAQSSEAALVRGQGGEVWHIIRPPYSGDQQIESGDAIIPHATDDLEFRRTIEGVYQHG